MDRLFVDTSAWYALVNRDDPEHAMVSGALRTFAGRLVTSNFVFDETVSLCFYRLGHALAEKVGAKLLDPGVTDLLWVTAEDEAEAWRLFVERPDQRYSFTDCTSFVLLRRLGLRRVAALDEDFRREGFELVP